MTFVSTKKVCINCGKSVNSGNLRFIPGPSGIGYRRIHSICPPVIPESLPVSSSAGESGIAPGIPAVPTPEGSAPGDAPTSSPGGDPDSSPTDPSGDSSFYSSQYEQRELFPIAKGKKSKKGSPRS